MSPKGLLLLCILAAMPASLWAQEALPAGGNLGQVWRLRESTPGREFRGTWTRRGSSASFMLAYTDLKTKGQSQGVVTIVSINGREVTAKLQQSSAVYTGTIQSDGRTIRGKANWYANCASCYWEAVTDWDVAAMGLWAGEQIKLGTVWRVHDYTLHEYDWHGTWTLDPTTKIIRFRYRNAKDGQTAEGTFRLTTHVGEKVVILNQTQKRYFRGTVQPDGKTIKGTADWCLGRSGCGWDAVIEK